MKNNFDQSTYELFDLGGYCMSWETGINNADCLHHICGRCSNSPYNAAPLNNRNDHMPEGRKQSTAINSEETKIKYLQKTKKYLDSINYKPNKEDLAFLENNAKYYKLNLKL